MRTVGLPWCLRILFLLLVSQQTLQMILFPRVPGWMSRHDDESCGDVFLWLIMFNMMGTSFSASPPAGMVWPPLRSPRDAGDSSDAIGRLIGAGQIDEALELAYEARARGTGRRDRP